MSADPETLIPSALITPIQDSKPLELITPDQSAEIRRLTTTSGVEQIDPRQTLLPAILEKKKAGGHGIKANKTKNTSGFKDSAISPSPMPDPGDEEEIQRKRI